MAHMQKRAEEFRRAIPFLQQIPILIYEHLDTREWFMPDPDVNCVRMRLEKELGHFVMTYHRDVFNRTIPVESHLCANIQGALLTDKQLEMLKQEENKLSYLQVSFVAYQKPLKITNPSESSLGVYYKTMGFV